MDGQFGKDLHPTICTIDDHFDKDSSYGSLAGSDISFETNYYTIDFRLENAITSKIKLNRSDSSSSDNVLIPETKRKRSIFTTTQDNKDRRKSSLFNSKFSSIDILARKLRDLEGRRKSRNSEVSQYTTSICKQLYLHITYRLILCTSPCKLVAILIGIFLFIIGVVMSCNRSIREDVIETINQFHEDFSYNFTSDTEYEMNITSNDEYSRTISLW
ncbi:hypothetical protein LSTR_LSTR014185 [Laodelphax striatellus]|uniref:Uncharacterized protein n=1 Tax=Laodelphax striatellus TaxID=195883 RepID=A0A482WNQ5_LAOST|nr:hypothetical protein LSTR_LSTR014185 [Laodelphax striatellus]